MCNRWSSGSLGMYWIYKKWVVAAKETYCVDMTTNVQLMLYAKSIEVSVSPQCILLCDWK